MKRRYLPAFSSLMLNWHFCCALALRLLYHHKQPRLVPPPHEVSDSQPLTDRSWSRRTIRKQHLRKVPLCDRDTAHQHMGRIILRIQRPTTINIFGFLCIVVGVIDSLISSVFIAFPYDKKTI